MGVQGLWTLITPVARPIKLETMGNKKLAIDSSIWLYQFQNAMRDREGRGLINAHILGFLRRISKLLYYGIKPVFVFDGGAPVLKKQTIVERKKRKQGGQESLAKTAEKLLAAQLRQAAVVQVQRRAGAKEHGDQIAPNAVYFEDNLARDFAEKNHIPSRAKRPTPASSPIKESPKKTKYVPKDQYQLPPLTTRTPPKESDHRLATEEELSDFIDQMKPEDLDINSPHFQALSTEMKYEIIGDLRVKSRQQNHARVEAMKRKNDQEFSQVQILNLKQRNELTQKLLTVTDMVGKANLTIPVKIAAQRNKEYVLVKAQEGWVLGMNNHEGDHQRSPTKIDLSSDEEESFEEVTRVGNGVLHSTLLNESFAEDSDEADFEEVAIPSTHQPGPMQDVVESHRNTPKDIRSNSLERRRSFYTGSRLFHPDEDEEEEKQIMMEIAAEFSQHEALSIPNRFDAFEPSGVPELAGHKSYPIQRPRDLGEGSSKPVEKSWIEPSDRRHGTQAPIEDPIEPMELDLEMDDDFASFAPPESQARPVSQKPDHTMSNTVTVRSETLAPTEVTGEELNAQIALELEDEFSTPSIPCQPTINTCSSILKKNVNASIDLELDDVFVDPPQMSARSPESIQQSIGSNTVMVEPEKSKISKTVDQHTADPYSTPFLEGSVTAGPVHLANAPQPVPKSRISEGDQSKQASVNPDERACPDVVSRQFIETSQAIDEGTEGMSSDVLAVPGVVPNTEHADKLTSTSKSNSPITSSPAISTRPLKSVEPLKTSAQAVARIRRSSVTTLSDSHPTPGTPSHSVRSQYSAVPMKDPILPSKSLSPSGGNAPLSETTRSPLRARAATSGSGSNVGVTQVSMQIEEEIVTDEEPIPWSRSPTPVSRKSKGKQPESTTINAASDAEDDELEVTLEAEERELAHNLENESNQWTHFLSGLQDAEQLDEMRHQADLEVNRLKEQRVKDRRDADDVNVQMSKDIQAMLRLFGIPYVISPMEAEAQCAELFTRGLVDGIITDDSDVFLFGGTRVYKNMFNQNKFVECYLMNDLEKELGLGRDKLIQLAYLLGSDYTEGLAGVGPVTAMEILSEFDDGEGTGDSLESLIAFKRWWMKVQVGKDSENESGTAFRKKFRKKKDKIWLEDSWPNPAIAEAYHKPTVDTSDQKFTWGLPDLDGIRQFLSDHLNWPSNKTDDVILPLIKRQTQRTNGVAHTQGILDNFFDYSLTDSTTARAPPPRIASGFQSQKLQTIVQNWKQKQREKQVQNNDLLIVSGPSAQSSETVPARSKGKSKAGPAQPKKRVKKTKALVVDDSSEPPPPPRKAKRAARAKKTIDHAPPRPQPSGPDPLEGTSRAEGSTATEAPPPRPVRQRTRRKVRSDDDYQTTESDASAD